MHFPYLYAEFKDLTAAFDLLTGKQIKKIVFQFHFNTDAEINQPTLVGYVAKQQGEFTTDRPVITLLKSTSMHPVEIIEPFNLGSIEFSRQEFEDLKNPKKYLVFVPLKSTVFKYSNAVTYKTAFSEYLVDPKNITTLAIGDELNPSPPKQPVL